MECLIFLLYLWQELSEARPPRWQGACNTVQLVKTNEIGPLLAADFVQSALEWEKAFNLRGTTKPWTGRLETPTLSIQPSFKENVIKISHFLRSNEFFKLNFAVTR